MPSQGAVGAGERRGAGDGAPSQFVSKVDSCRWLIDLNERVSRTLYLYGNFEPALTELFGAILSSGGTFFDVGANFGYFSILAARRVGSEGRVVAFEPDPRNIQRLETNISLNGLSRIQVVPSAVCEEAGTVALHMSADTEDNLGSSSIVQDGAGRKTIDVRAISLDDFLREFPGNVDVLKMDIEGAELSALRGARQTLAAGKIRSIVLELHRLALNAQEVAAVHEIFTSAGYHGWVVGERHSEAAFSALSPLKNLDQLVEPNPHLFYSLATELPRQS